MAKGPEKNTKNKALHTKLMNRKKAKLQEEKREKALRMKALVTKMNEMKKSKEEKIESRTNRIRKNNCFRNRF